MALVDSIRDIIRRAVFGPVTSAPIWRKQDATSLLAAPEASPELYKQVATVYACVKLRADNIAKMPFVVYKGDPNGNNDRVPATHPLQMLLDRVNPWYTRGQLWRYTETALCLWGNAYWLLLPNSRGQLAEIWPLRPSKVKPIPGQDVFLDGFEYDMGGSDKLRIPADQMLWMRYHNPFDDYCGLSPLAAANLPAAINREALAWNHRFFLNGAEPGRLYIKSEQNLTQEQVTDLEAQWAKKFRGYARSHRVPIFGAGSDLKTLALTQHDMEFLATQRYTKEEICSIYGVPPPLVGDLERATYSNIVEARKTLWNETLLPEANFIRDEVNENIAPKYGPNIYTDFDTSKIEALQEDATARSARDVQEIGVGLRTINEIRAERNQEPVPWGDTWWMPFSLSPAGEQPPTPEPIPPAPPENNDEEDDEDEKALTRRDLLGLRPEHRRPMLEAQADTLLAATITYTTSQASIMDAHLKRVTTRERSMAAWLKREFKRELADVLDRLNGAKHIGGVMVKQTVEELFTFDEIATRLAKEGWPYMEAALAAAGKDAAVMVGGVWDVTNPRVVRWLGERTMMFGKQITETTGKAITAQLVEAHAAGDSIDAIADRLRGIPGFDPSSARATTIARTEMVSASNQGALEAYVAAGVARKQWLSALAETTRPSHAALHLTTVGVSEDFDLGGHATRAPGQSGIPGEDINCMCTLAPVQERERSATYCPQCRRFLGKGLVGEAHCPKCSKLVEVQ